MPKSRLLGAQRCWPRVVFVLIAFSLSLCGRSPALNAQTCGAGYAVKEGESLADIAAKVYGSSSQWTLIFYANQDRMGLLSLAEAHSPDLQVGGFVQSRPVSCYRERACFPRMLQHHSALP